MALLAFYMLTGCSNPWSNTKDIDLSTPEAAVLNLYQAFNNKDIQLFRSIIDIEDDSNRRVLKAFEQQVNSGVFFIATDIEMDIVENDGRIARVRTRFYEKILINGQVVAEGNTGSELTLIHKNGNWYHLGLGEWPPPGWVKELP